MSKVHLRESKFSDISGYSKIIKSSPYGVFVRYACVDPEDADIKNKWDGCKIAEKRVDIDIQKERTKALNKRAKSIEEAFNYVKKNRTNSIKSDYELLEELYHSAKNQANENKIKLQCMKKYFSKYVDYILDERKSMRKQIEEHKSVEKSIQK